jgi:hypothetical protein
MEILAEHVKCSIDVRCGLPIIAVEVANRATQSVTFVLRSPPNSGFEIKCIPGSRLSNGRTDTESAQELKQRVQN